MSEEYTNVMKGKLKLKGMKPLKEKKSKKKKKRKREAEEVELDSNKKQEVEIEEFDVTEHQKKHQEVVDKIVTAKIVKSVSGKTYRERVDEYNRYLSTLTEHNDIPRISAAGNG